MLAVGIVRTFLISSVSVVVVALVLIGIAFWRISKRPKTGVSSSETNDSEYLIYSKKGYVLRICYAICVAADYILIILEIAATGLSAYIALTPGAETYPIAVLLIISFIASTFRNALSLKHLRKAYAEAFRILEFAVDAYRISDKTAEDKHKLQQENERAQQVIASYNE